MKKLLMVAVAALAVFCMMGCGGRDVESLYGMYIYDNNAAILLRPESYNNTTKQATWYWGGDVTQSANMPHSAMAWSWNGYADDWEGTDDNVTYVMVSDNGRLSNGDLYIDFDREEVYESEGEFVDKRNGKSYVFIPWKEISGE